MTDAEAENLDHKLTAESINSYDPELVVLFVYSQATLCIRAQCMPGARKLVIS